MKSLNKELIGGILVWLCFIILFSSSFQIAIRILNWAISEPIYRG